MEAITIRLEAIAPGLGSMPGGSRVTCCPNAFSSGVASGSRAHCTAQAAAFGAM